MPLPDFTDATLDEIRDWISAASQAYHSKEQAERDDITTRREAIAAEIATLQALKGDPDAPADLASIEGMLKTIQPMTNAQVQAATKVGFDLILKGMRVLTQTQLDLARVVASQQQ